jgi:hypothetical protein
LKKQRPLGFKQQPSSQHHPIGKGSQIQEKEKNNSGESFRHKVWTMRPKCLRHLTLFPPRFTTSTENGEAKEKNWNIFVHKPGDHERPKETKMLDALDPFSTLDHNIQQKMEKQRKTIGIFLCINLKTMRPKCLEGLDPSFFIYFSLVFDSNCILFLQSE